MFSTQHFQKMQELNKRLNIRGVLVLSENSSIAFAKIHELSYSEKNQSLSFFSYKTFFESSSQMKFFQYKNTI